MSGIKKGGFSVETDYYDEDDALGKRKRLDGSSYTIFGIRLHSLEGWYLRYRPVWNYNGSGASLMVYEGLCKDNQRVWECVRYAEYYETKRLDKQKRESAAAEEREDELLQYHFVHPPSEGYDIAIGPHSFWANFTDAPINTKVRQFQAVHFELKGEDRASLDLHAIVHMQEREYVLQPECEQHYSMHLELVHVAN